MLATRLGSRLAVRLTVTLLGVAALGMGVMGVYVARALELQLVESLRDGLATSAGLLHDAFLPAVVADVPAEHGQALAERYAALLRARVTVIGADGRVLADSERDPPGVRAMENHASRPEVRAALAGRIGSDVRRSRTLDVGMLYVALPLGDGPTIHGVLRVALPLTRVAEAGAAIRRTVAVGAGLALVAALGVGLFLGRRVTRPVQEMQAAAHRMTAGEFGRLIPVRGTDEIAALGHALNLMAAGLQEKIRTLEGERAKVAAMLESMVEGVIAVDRERRILLMNPGARAIFGLGQERVEGRTFLEVVRHKELFDLVESCRASGTGARSRREVELGPPVNRVLEANAVSAALTPDAGGVLLVLHDITELRRLERVRAEFVANVSHELRTPLTAVKGYLETLRDGALEEGENARRFVEVAHAHADRLSRLVDDLLQLSDLETGKVRLEPASVPLRDVVESVGAMFDRQLARRGLVFVNDAPADFHALADRDRLFQILVNLVDNAVKYTPAGGRVTVSALSGPRGFVEIRVADTGVGIPSSDLPRITERFYRVDKARSRELGGTGLGLAIVKHLVQAHGGELRIESELGKGTTVCLTLPAA